MHYLCSASCNYNSNILIILYHPFTNNARVFLLQPVPRNLAIASNLCISIFYIIVSCYIALTIRFTRNFNRHTANIARCQNCVPSDSDSIARRQHIDRTQIITQIDDEGKFTKGK